MAQCAWSTHCEAGKQYGHKEKERPPRPGAGCRGGAAEDRPVDRKSRSNKGGAGSRLRERDKREIEGEGEGIKDWDEVRGTSSFTASRILCHAARGIRIRGAKVHGADSLAVLTIVTV
jgi:hypothetical protein